jgi:UDP-N-acetylmuramoyl-L-alanyl-D-glutamate--2,6-diaminopimelate ligase
MGRVAAELADVAVLTSDNPRSEEPQAILHQIESGVKEVGPAERRLGDYRIVEDRKAAIGWAIATAQAGDAVVIAGKGHEDYQIIGAARLSFDDRNVAREALRARFVAA